MGISSNNSILKARGPIFYSFCDKFMHKNYGCCDNKDLNMHILSIIFKVMIIPCKILAKYHHSFFCPDPLFDNRLQMVAEVFVPLSSYI